MNKVDSKPTDIEANEVHQEINGDGLPKRTCILVLGMHRSGTSAITRVLSYMGAALPLNILGANEGNETGHWEPERLIAIHDELLSELGSSWDDWQLIDLDRLTQERKRYYQKQVQTTIQDEYKDVNLFVLKDPRVCILLPFYRELFEDIDVDIKVVAQFRNPIEVMDSLQTRNGMFESDAALLWLQYVLRSEKTSRGLDRVFIKYEDVVNNWRSCHETITNFLNVNWPYKLDEIEDQIDQFVRPNLCHHNHKDEEVLFDPLLRQWVGEAYNALLVLQKNPDSENAQKRLDEIKKEFEAASPMLVQIKSSITQSFECLISEHDKQNVQKDAVIAEIEQKIAQKDEVITEVEQKIAQKDDVIAERDQHITQKDDMIAERERQITQKDELIAEQEQQIALKDDVISEQEQRIYQLQQAVQCKSEAVKEIYDSTSWRITKPFRLARVQYNRLFRFFSILLFFIRKPVGFNSTLQKIWFTLKNFGVIGLYRKTSNYIRSCNINRHTIKASETNDNTLEDIRNSGQFDIDFYLKKYPDVENSNFDPIEHYCKFGWKELRDPNKIFLLNFI